MTIADSIGFAMLVAVLLVAAISDVRTGNISNKLTYPAVLVGLAFWTICGFATGDMDGAMHKLGGSAWAAAVGVIPFALLFLRANALGGGDAKLMGAVGALSASWACVVETALLAFIFGMIFAIVTMVHHRVVGRTLRRVFAAALSLAARVQPEIPQDGPRVAFGLAIACGAVLAGMKHMLKLPVPLMDWGL